MKLLCLISILAFCQVGARLTLPKIEELQKATYKSDTFGLQKVRQEGPLGFLHTYIYHKKGYMHNKRFYSPVIETSYSLVKNRKADKTSPTTFTFIRAPNKDTVHPLSKSADEESSYLESYHANLIRMFPSSTGDLSIESGRYNSLTRFLRSREVQKHTSHILAALFLLARGVQVELMCNKEEKTLLLKNKKGGVLFDIPMRISGYSNKNSKKKKNIPQKEAEMIISFFIECCASRPLSTQHILSQEISLEEFNKGKFLDSPEFLIDTYIFEFIESVESAKNFARAVHEMLIDCVEEELCIEHQASLKEAALVLNQCFVSVESAEKSELSQLDVLKSIHNTTQKYKVTPFYDSSYFLEYTVTPCYNRELKRFTHNPVENFSNCVEAGILTLFCCFAYEPSTQSYTTSHIKSPSDDLREFFYMYPEPVESADRQLHMAWGRVVSDLKGGAVYLGKGNELETGILNMLSVLVEVANLPKEKLNMLIERVNSITGSDQDVFADIKQYTTEVFTVLSYNKSLQVNFADLNKGYLEDGGVDVFGKITLAYIHGDVENAIEFILSRKHMSISLPASANNKAEVMVKEILEVQKGCRQPWTFFEHLLMHYISSTINSIMEGTENRAAIIYQIKKVHADPIKKSNSLFLLKKIENIEYKREIVSRLIIYSKIEDLHACNPVVRFTSNIIGSVPLGDRATQRKMLAASICTGRCAACYPNVQLEEYDLNLMIEYTYEVVQVFNYIIGTQNPSMLLHCLNVYMRKIGYYSISTHNPLTSRYLTQNMFKCLFADRTMKYADKVLEFATKYWSEVLDIESQLCFIWFHYACERFPSEKELLKDLYNGIQNIDDMHSWYGFLNLSRADYCRIVSVLDSLSLDTPELAKESFNFQQIYGSCLYYCSVS
ncbi:uncharacterized protein NESG_02411 [Nematocida ausubeli]|uniref:Uncharacterized protein n=1 Tax=Nematocida ausubeli (strain ATCC PRA-371 / ERTm2) TaxID=1913371 RepID=A0A086IZ73_NEMA1|nr:uncharacterized protein NESG_02411 [Nematocida ausubeli]KFG25191.1 hypothetical protein NESG_02411 [Nematocida ausubeli]